MTTKSNAKQSKSRFGDRKKEMQSLWKANKDRIPGVPPGTYIMRLSKLTFEEAKSSGKLQTVRVHTVLSGEHAGSEIKDRLGFETEGGPYYTAKFLENLGYATPDDIDDIDDLYAEIVEDGQPYRASVTHNGDFINVRIEELVDEDEIDIDDDDEEEEDDAEVEQSDEDESEDESEDDDDDEEEEDDAEVEQSDEDESEDESEDDDDDEEEEDDPDLAVLVAVADAYGVAGVEECADADELAAVLKDYEWDADELDEDERRVMEAYGVIAAPKKKAASPKKKAAPAAGKKKK